MSSNLHGLLASLCPPRVIHSPSNGTNTATPPLVWFTLFNISNYPARRTSGSIRYYSWFWQTGVSAFIIFIDSSILLLFLDALISGLIVYMCTPVNDRCHVPMWRNGFGSTRLLYACLCRTNTLTLLLMHQIALSLNCSSAIFSKIILWVRVIDYSAEAHVLYQTGCLCSMGQPRPISRCRDHDLSQHLGYKHSFTWRRLFIGTFSGISCGCPNDRISRLSKRSTELRFRLPDHSSRTSFNLLLSIPRSIATSLIVRDAVIQEPRCVPDDFYTQSDSPLRESFFSESCFHCFDLFFVLWNL
jgi:hypothetical protein